MSGKFLILENFYTPIVVRNLSTQTHTNEVHEYRAYCTCKKIFRRNTFSCEKFEKYKYLNSGIIILRIIEAYYRVMFCKYVYNNVILLTLCTSLK